MTRRIIRQAFSGSHIAPMGQRPPICGCRFPNQAHRQGGTKIGAMSRFSGMKTSGGSVSGLIGCRDDEGVLRCLVLAVAPDRAISFTTE